MKLGNLELELPNVIKENREYNEAQIGALLYQPWIGDWSIEGFYWENGNGTETEVKYAMTLLYGVYWNLSGFKIYECVNEVSNK